MHRVDSGMKRNCLNHPEVANPQLPEHKSRRDIWALPEYKVTKRSQDFAIYIHIYICIYV